METVDVVDGLGSGKVVECLVGEFDVAATEGSQQLVDAGQSKPGEATIGSLHRSEGSDDGLQLPSDGSRSVRQQRRCISLQDASQTAVSPIELGFCAAFDAVDIEADPAAGPTRGACLAHSRQ